MSFDQKSSPFGGSDTIKRKFIDYLRSGIDDTLRVTFRDSIDERETVQDFLRSLEGLSDGPEELYVKLFGMAKTHKDNRDGLLYITEYAASTHHQRAAEW